MKELIEYLEKKGFIEEANSLRNGGTTLSLVVGIFSNKNIGVEGARALADALKTNTSLTSLNLYYNQIGDDLATKKQTN